MIFKSLRDRIIFVQRKVDYRIMIAVRVAESYAREYSRSTDRFIPEIVITSARRSRNEQIQLNLREGRSEDFVSFHEEDENGVIGAVDLRINDWPLGLARLIKKKIESIFPEVQFIVERDHMHVELAGRYDRKVEIQMRSIENGN